MLLIMVLNHMGHYKSFWGHWGRTGWTSAYHGDMDDPAHQSLG